MRQGNITAVQSFMPFQGHQFRYQLKARKTYATSYVSTQ